MRIHSCTLLLLPACTGQAKVGGDRPDQGSPDSTAEEELIDTDLSRDTGTVCEDTWTETSIDDETMGFSASDLLLELSSAPYASVAWTVYPAGLPSAETMHLTCADVPSRALMLTRIDHAGLGEDSCPPGPELFAVVECSISVGAGGITGSGDAYIGGASSEDIVIWLYQYDVTLDASHSAAAAAAAPGGGVDSISAADLQLAGPLAAPVLNVGVTAGQSRGTAWDGVASHSTL